MSYTIIARIIDSSDVGFTVVEKATMSSGTWSDTDGINTLTMDSSGTSGGLRFRSTDGAEIFYVALGVHNYKRWCDIVTDLVAQDSGVKLQPEYYESGKRNEMLWKQLPEIEKTSAKGRKITVTYVKEEKSVFHVHIVIA